jgi:hypothetical protein
VQKDLDKLRRNKRRLHRVMAILAITALAAVIVVGVRACSEQYQEPYNKGYHPLDTETQSVARPKN